MDIETFRTFCLTLPGTTEDIKWEDHLCFMIENKIYIMCSLTPPHSFSFKIEAEEFDKVANRPGMAQAPYLAKRQWIRVNNLEVFTDEELKARVTKSRALILGKLTKKVQEKYK